METKIDLGKLTGLDWEKYKKMHRVAFRQKINTETVIVIILGIILLALTVGIIYPFVSALNHANRLTNYSSNQTIVLLHNLNTSFNITNYTHWTNATLTNLISAMRNNPKALSAFTVNTYTTMQSYFYLCGFSIVALLILFCIMFFTYTNLSGIPVTYTYFRKKFNRLTERDGKLKAYGYTEQEIVWYHAVRAELIKLELDYYM